jgi:lysophospholipid acyltransferase (LPLAT)-like uncharacterized protein
MIKKLLKSEFAARTASLFIRFYIRLVEVTCRWKFIGREHFDAADAKGKGVIIAFWHGRLLMAPIIRKESGKRVFMLISANRDGEIIAQGVRKFGVEFIRGSAANPDKPGKNKSGASAIAQMIAALNDGAIVGFTPDGPRGPGEKVKSGVIRLSQMSGAPILPAAYSTSGGSQLNTWDRFLLAAPFSRGVFVAGPAIEAPKDNSLEAVETARRRLENALLEVTREADVLVGRRRGAKLRIDMQDEE